LGLVVDNVTIERICEFKYLGIFFDSKLNFKSHGEYIEKRCCSAIGGIIRLKRFINTRIFALLVNTDVVTLTEYCVDIWGWQYFKNLKKIQKRIDSLLISFFFPHLAKYQTKGHWAKAVKDGKSLEEQSKCKKLFAKINLFDLYERCGILTIKERLELNTMVLVFKFLKYGSDIGALKDFYQLENTRNYHVQTRSCITNNLVLPKSNQKMFNGSVKYAAAKAWNALPSICKSLTHSLENFKKYCIVHHQIYLHL
jgi:hypothetical protein